MNRPRRFRLAVLASFLASSAVLTACSGGGSPEAEETKAPAQGAEELAYYRCLEESGVVLEKGEDGQLRVDKDKLEADSFGNAVDKCAVFPPGSGAASATPTPS